MIVLGIESSCDDTGAAVVAEGLLRSNVVATQLDHEIFGGVVPEVAARLHEQKIIPVVDEALSTARISLEELSGIAVTYGPGLAGALVVGLNFAKGLSQALNIPLIGVDHMEGHLWANYLDDQAAPDGAPFLCLLVSGGHTQIWRVDGLDRYTLFGRTLDDAAGEAFDKGARLLGLGFPGGPAIQTAAEGGNPRAVKFPRPLAGADHCDFSFSGLKTALYYYLQKLAAGQRQQNLADIAASYQQAIIDSLLDRLQQALHLTGLRRVCVAGGVSANALLRRKLDQWANDESLEISYPPLDYCTDNAAMIAMAGYAHFMAGQRAALDLEINPNLSLADHGRP